MFSTFKFPDIPKEPLHEDVSSHLLSSTSSLSSLPSIVPDGEPPNIERPTTPKEKPALDYSLTINQLVQSDIQYSSAKIAASTASSKLLENVIQCQVTHRLSNYLDTFYKTLATACRTEPHKLAPAFYQARDLSSSILKQTATYNSASFGSSLRPGTLESINTFISRVRDPNFLVSVFLGLSTSDMDSFVSEHRSQDAFEQLASLNRTKPLDILFNCIFPPDAPFLLRAEYFSTICSRLMENKRGEKFCFALFDKFMDQPGYPSSSGLELLLITMLQDGTFLTLGNAVTSGSNGKYNSSASPSPIVSSVAQALSTTSSPEVTHATLAIPSSATSGKPTPKSSSLSLNSSVGGPSDEKVSAFLEQSVNMLFEYFDNPSIEPYPQAFLNFVQLTVAKISEPNRNSAILLITVKYFFNKYLQRVITSPEQLGILHDFYLTEQQRQKILVPVFDKLYKLVVSAAYYYDQGTQQVGIDRAKSHLDSIMARFATAPVSAQPPVSPISRKKDQSLSSSSLVLSPSDISSLFKALLPNNNTRRQSTAQLTSGPRNIERGTSRSYSGPSPGTSLSTAMYLTLQPRFSGSGYSPFQHDINPSISYVSTSATQHNNMLGNSMTSIATTRDQSVNSDTAIDLEAPSSAKSASILTPLELPYNLDEFRSEMVVAMEELTTRFPYLQFRDQSAYSYSLRPNVQHFKVPHPLSEKWQVFRINPDSSINAVFGETLLDHHITVSNSANYLRLEEEVHLMERGNILVPSNRPLLRAVENALSKIVSEVSSSPFMLDNMIASDQSPSPTYLVDLLQDALARTMAKGQFLDSNEYSTAIQCLEKLLPDPEFDRVDYQQTLYAVNNYLISCLARDKASQSALVRRKLASCDAQSIPFKIHIDSSRKRCESMIEQLSYLRAKVWYAVDVRPTPLWHRAREVALSLAYPHAVLEKETQSLSGYQFPYVSTAQAVSPVLSAVGLERNNSSSSIVSSAGSANGDENRSSGFSLRRFTSGSKRHNHAKRQSIISTSSAADDMFAPKELAGDMKLSDRESEATKNWIEGQDIQILCNGEERIHRFCCEVDDLVKRVMGDAITSKRNRGHSILTSSSLYRNDLWKSIIEVEGVYRMSTSSTVTSFSGSGQANNKRHSMYSLDNGDNLKSTRRQSIDSTTPENLPVSGHKAQRSSPNLLDMISSLDLGGASHRKSDASQDSAYESSNWADPAGYFGSTQKSDRSARHRRNKSLSEVQEFDAEIDMRRSFVEEEEHSDETDLRRKQLDEQIFELQMRLTSFIYTDIGMYCWSEGSETDKWLDSPLVKEAVRYKEVQRKKLKNCIATAPIISLMDPPGGKGVIHVEGSLNNISTEDKAAPPAPIATPLTLDTPTSLPRQFHFDDAYRRILQRLSTNPSPIGKLNTLHELELLVVSSLSSNPIGLSSHTPGSIRSTPHHHRSIMTSSVGSESPFGHKLTGSNADRMKELYHQSATRNSSISTNLPAALISLGEAIATVEAKRSSSLGHPVVGSRVGPNTDMIAEELRRVLSSPDIKSHTLFRDLQFIAAFVSPQVLDLTDMGKAFWDVSLAALSLKEETVMAMVDAAQAIFQSTTGMIGDGVGNGGSGGIGSEHNISDCAALWSIAAKEGEMTSQRELALMLMSHPEITPKCLMPFAKISLVFDSAVIEDAQSWDDPDKADPVRMAVIRHLMSTSAAYGDVIANEYLKQTGEAF